MASAALVAAPAMVRTLSHRQFPLSDMRGDRLASEGEPEDEGDISSYARLASPVSSPTLECDAGKELRRTRRLTIGQHAPPQRYTKDGFPIPLIKVSRPPDEASRSSTSTMASSDLAPMAKASRSASIPEQDLSGRHLYVPLRTEQIGWESGGIYWQKRYCYPIVNIYGGGIEDRVIGRYRGGPRGYSFVELYEQDAQQPTMLMMAAAAAAANAGEQHNATSGSMGAASLAAPEPKPAPSEGASADVDLLLSDSDEEKEENSMRLEALDSSDSHHSYHSARGEPMAVQEHEEEAQDAYDDEAVALFGSSAVLERSPSREVLEQDDDDRVMWDFLPDTIESGASSPTSPSSDSLSSWSSSRRPSWSTHYRSSSRADSVDTELTVPDTEKDADTMEVSPEPEANKKRFEPSIGSGARGRDSSTKVLDASASVRRRSLPSILTVDTAIESSSSLSKPAFRRRACPSSERLQQTSFSSKKQLRRSTSSPSLSPTRLAQDESAQRV